MSWKSCKLVHVSTLTVMHCFYTVQWLIGYVIPTCTQELVDKYGYGLGLNTAQVLEAKHRDVVSYSKHATKQNRWPRVFRHESVELMWLKTQEPTAENYKVMELKDSLKLLPSSVSDSGNCDCGLPASCCKICSTDVYKLVMASSRCGEVHSDLRKLL